MLMGDQTIVVGVIVIIKEKIFASGSMQGGAHTEQDASLTTGVESVGNLDMGHITVGEPLIKITLTSMTGLTRMIDIMIEKVTKGGTTGTEN